MRIYVNLLLIACLSLCSCGKPEKKSASFEFTDTKFNISQSHEQSYALDVKGKIRNTSSFDVKKVVVTAYCRSCIPQMQQNKWWISGTEKTPTQETTISYLASGAEADFSFKEVAFYFTFEKKKPEDIPEDIEFKVESYDVVKD